MGAQRESPIFGKVESAIHEAFEKQASKCPSSIAIRFLDRSISYAELDRQADQLACHLRDHFQVQPEATVAFCFQKSIYATIAFLAISKAGGCALALDPLASGEQLQHVVAQSGAVAIIHSLTMEALFDKDEKLKEIPKLVLNKQLLVSLPRASKESLPKVHHSSAAYIIFTSGSTGTPKGSLIEHGSASTAIAAHEHLLADLVPGDCHVLQFSSYTFDVSILETLVALSFGYCLCVLDEYQRVNDLANNMERLQINMAFLTPTVIGLIEPLQVPSLKVLISTGEPLSRKILQLWAPKVRLVNLYGMSEAPILCVSLPRIEIDSNPYNIGAEVVGKIHLASVDDIECLVPDGETGELIAQAPTIAREYLAAPEKTNASFIQPPLWASRFADDGRLYRTGDLGYRNSSGDIIVIGRADAQVKLHGKRIDLGEIEEKLRSCPLVAQVAIEKVKREDFQESLMAFVVPTCKEQRSGCFSFEHPSKSLNSLICVAPILEDWKSIVPRGVLPSFVLPVNELPRTSTGKIDRRTIAKFIVSVSPETLRKSKIENLKSKKNSDEMSEETRVMRNLWAEVLMLEPDSLSASDNFLDSGGNSLAAIRLANEACKHGFALNVSLVYKHPVLADMATYSLKSSPFVSQWKPPPLDMTKYRERLNMKKPTFDWERVYPASILQAVELKSPEILPDKAYAHHITRISGMLDISRLRAACRVLVETTPILRTIFFEDEVYDVVQAVAHPSDVEERFFTFASKAEAESFWALHESYCNRFLTTFSLVPVSDKESWFAVGLHHSQVDAWATQLVFSRLSKIYQGDSPPQTPDFIDFLHFKNTKPKEEYYSWWRKHLQGSIPTYISDVPPNAQRFDPTGVCLTESLPDLPLSAISLGTALHAACAITLSKHTGKTDIVFFTVGIGRVIDLDGVAEICGPSMMMVTIRLQIEPSWTYKEVVKAYANHRIAMQPYECMDKDTMVEDITDWPNPKEMPVALNYAGDEDGILPDTLGKDGPKWRYDGSRGEVKENQIIHLYFVSFIRQGRAMVEMYHDPRHVSYAKAKELHSCLCDTVKKVYDTPNQRVGSN